MSQADRPWIENEETGPEITPERRGILTFIDDRIAALLRKAKGRLDSEEIIFGAQLLQALRGDLRQELDK